jgi:hypothetical protein
MAHGLRPAGRGMRPMILFQPRGLHVTRGVTTVGALGMSNSPSAGLFELLPRHNGRLVRALFVARVSRAQPGIHPADERRRNPTGAHRVADRAFDWLASLAHPVPGREFSTAAALIMVSGHQNYLRGNLFASVPGRCLGYSGSGAHYPNQQQISREPACKYADDRCYSAGQPRNIHFPDQQ